jgi:transposase-like protein
MPGARHQQSPIQPPDLEIADAGLQSAYQMRSRHLNCSHCEYPLECVELNRRSGTWLGSFICPKCRSEYFYAYRWGRLMRKE